MGGLTGAQMRNLVAKRQERGRTSVGAHCAHVARDDVGRLAVAENEHAYIAYCAVRTEWKANLTMMAPGNCDD